jgi:hypothetical protein
MQNVARELVKMQLPVTDSKEQPFPTDSLKKIQQWQSDIRSSP